MEKTKWESTSRVHASLPKHFQQDSSFPGYLQRKMVVGCGPAVSSEASHQPAGRQSISLAPPPLSRLLVPSVSINVDSCQSQRESMRKKNPKESHNTPAVAQGSVNDWICWIGASGLRPVGSLPHPAAAILCPPHSLLSAPMLIYSQLVLFLCDPFSPALPQASALLSAWCPAPSERRSWRRIPAESSKAAPSPAWCTIKDHEGRPEPISSLSGIRLLFWLTRKDRMEKFKVWSVGNSLALQCVSLKKFWASGKRMWQMKSVWSCTRCKLGLVMF